MLQGAATQNTLIGALAGDELTTAARNTAVGYKSLHSVTTGNDNVGIGTLAGAEITTGSENTAIGYAALDLEDTGNRNTAVGFNALSTQNIDGNGQNSALGWQAGLSLDSGTVNTLIGAQAGTGLVGGGGNTILGYAGGTKGTDLAGGDNNVLLGRETGTSGADGSNQIVIGKDVAGTANDQAHLGYGSNIAVLALDGSDTSWAASSDERLKENITTSTAGLSFLKDLRPVTYTWKKKKDVPSNMTTYYEEGSDDPCLGFGKTHHGFIAQEVKTVLDNHAEIKNGQHFWKQDDNGTQRVAPNALIPMLTKAVQELSTALDAALARITTLEG